MITSLITIQRIDKSAWYHEQDRSTKLLHTIQLFLHYGWAMITSITPSCARPFLLDTFCTKTPTTKITKITPNQIQNIIASVSELLICKVNKFRFGSIKNCARWPIRIPFWDFFDPFRSRYIRYFFKYGTSWIHSGTAYYVLFRDRYIRHLSESAKTLQWKNACENRGEMGSSLVTQDSTQRGFCWILPLYMCRW